MRRQVVFCGVVVGLTCFAAFAADEPQKEWSMNATIIEACSCPMFCQCYFDTRPAPPGGHAGHEGQNVRADAQAHDAHDDHGMAGGHYCKFNNAFQVNKGSYGDIKLDGAKFWIAGDLGNEFDDGEMDWAVLHFDPSVTREQRQGIQAAVAHLYPVKWKSFTVGEDKKIDWKATRDKAEARLDGGKAAEVILKKNQGMTDEPIVMKNLRYWGAPRNEGFVMMQNEVQALRESPKDQKAFEFKGTNGFMITFDISSKDVAAAQRPKG